MTRHEFDIIEEHILSLMQDSAHDKHHIYRVLYSAVDIASYEAGVDNDVLLASCLLHDIGRQRQFEDPYVCHAKVGGEMAFDFLLTLNWDNQKALHVKECISSHRYRSDNPPETMEAKILFDADKLDISGAMGIARSLIYTGQVAKPLYIVNNAGDVLTEDTGKETHSFFQEYNFKLTKLYSAFHTTRARQIAAQRQQAAVDFYNALYKEVTQNHSIGTDILSGLLTK